MRPLTMAEKILAAHLTDKDKEREISPGQLIECNLDLVLANDVTAPIAIREFERVGTPCVFDTKRIVLVPDHYTPNKDIKSATQAKIMRDFAHEQGIHNYFELGCMGIEHALLPERGLISPGMLVIGADSHTCTYGAFGALATGMGSTDVGVAFASGKAWFKVPETFRLQIEGSLKPFVTSKDIILYILGKIGVDGALYQAMEFSGSTIEALNMDERMTISNMAIEAGAKAGLMAPDATVQAYLKTRAVYAGTEYRSDKDAHFASTLEIDATEIEPRVAFPHLPSNVRPARDAHDIKIDQVVIGSCTNGRIIDMRQAARVLKGNKVDADVRCIIIPATQQVYKQCIAEGLIDIFLDANCVISTPTCGPCLGGHMGVLAQGERCVATTNRNFVGRMGHPASEVYLASPYVAAASAVSGCITSP